MLTAAGRALGIRLKPARVQRHTRCAGCSSPYAAYGGWEDAARVCAHDNPGASSTSDGRDLQPLTTTAERKGPLCSLCVDELAAALPGRVTQGRCAWCSPQAGWCESTTTTGGLYEYPDFLTDEEADAPCCWSCARPGGNFYESVSAQRRRRSRLGRV